ncbi:protein PEP-RELATED DEVELOPMENT ARRESTED 1, chloroplastic [Rhodamnia argentea]|uniref:Protein PEP-RELATED DEVELOPMENT ARRESTED 1, chloroplastic n=1 Tax=Rhodamnia argentea TaxID=178133 RepID=A0A8B8QL04_9MYRT|nr:protein PEP-RELATED DEVELOPMENT ARRESTED 1, chloroplastic [Rhodamnia argentea]XP_030547830.1 protein PEP-RELATED DEVELOPMENT ARRESTED 1, chloroplastic [Rhodamnia argentea]XP_030547831.1 protein PEP-RELATED DEVELOPMENT ARRESTED 1, chloroplastic [Rhodamnia argentea]
MALLSTVLLPTSPCPSPSPKPTLLPPCLSSVYLQSQLSLPRRHRFLKRLANKSRLRCSSSGPYEVGGAYPDEDLDPQDRLGTTRQGNRKVDSAQYEAVLKGGEQVTSVLQEMITLLEDMKMDEASEKVAVELAAQGVIGKRVDEMEPGFMMALDYMIQLAEKDQDDERKSLLEVIKETVLAHLTKKCPPHVQVIGLLCRTPQKESRHELLRRVAAGGGAFKGENGTKVHIPGANLNDIANQADDLLETMETRDVVPDRKLLARLVLIREEARNMMGGGILDERNDRGFSTLPQSEVNFLTKIVALKPGKTVQEMIKNVMEGKDEGADNTLEENSSEELSGGIAGRASLSGRRPFPVRPGMFLETLTKVLGGIYSGNVSGITAQHLEWVHQKTLQVLQEIAF